MADRYEGSFVGLSDPSRSVSRVTPDDGSDLPNVPRMLHIGVAGNISFIAAEDTEVITQPVPAGIFPVMVKRVLATGTTATSIMAIY